MGTAHGQVVDRAVDGQFPDVATGEKDGADDKRVGGESQASASHLQYHSVVESFQGRVVKGGQEHPLDEHLGQPSPSPVSQEHGRVLLDGNGTLKGKRFWFFCHISLRKK